MTAACPDSGCHDLRTHDPDPYADLGTILSIWAHPDDETYLAAGIMAAARDQGRRVVCASATAGELGTDDPAAWPPARLGQVRRWEAAAAMAVLGVHEHCVLGLPTAASPTTTRPASPGPGACSTTCDPTRSSRSGPTA